MSSTKRGKVSGKDSRANASDAKLSEFTGKSGTYFAPASDPIAFGRVSVILAGQDAKGNELCIKLFKERLASISERHDLFSELDAARRLQHPNILPIVDFGEHAETGRAFLVMPLCKRGSLEGLLRPRSFLPLSEAFPILEAVAGAIDFAHQGGVVHGDVKLSNILLADAPERPCLSDFGMAKYFLSTTTEMGGAASSSRQKRRAQGDSTRVIISKGGSIPYLSPEQVSLGVHSPKSDIYSFAIVAYELLTGRTPFRENDPFFFQLKAKVEGNIVPPSEANPALDAGVCDALTLGLEVDPKKRPSTARQLVAFLRGEQQIPARKPAQLGVPEKIDDQRAVFVVHGHDHGMLQTVARFLEHVGLHPIIVMERLSEGRTIIEQIERFANVPAAIVLMTCDDLGAAKVTKKDIKPRARQNVILELGYFFGKLGRERTVVICEPGVEIPSDFSGVVHTTLDPAGAWRLQLARTLAGLGLAVDAHSLVG